MTYPRRMARARTFLDERLADTARLDFAWLMTARRLRQSARVIKAAIEADERRHELSGSSASGVSLRDDPFPNLGLWPTYFLLAGLALENLAKGLIAHKHPELITDEGFSRDWPRHHKLVELFVLAGARLTWKEKRLLLGFDRYVVWVGKYVAPLDFHPGPPVYRHRVDRGLLWPYTFDPNDEPRQFEDFFTAIAGAV